MLKLIWRGYRQRLASRGWRNRLGVNRAAAAAKIGVGEKAIRDFEDSETEPGITVRLAMAAVEHGLAPIA